MSVYKKFTANDVAVIPFNAHKQYTFDSASAASNKVTYFDTRWTSESLDLYSSKSADTINTLKYNQLDHLYYRNFKRDLANRFGDKDYLGQQRELYENANIISMPAGLYGHQIKPGTFYLSSSNYIVVDDSKGNLIISGTNLDDYETDVRAKVLDIGPVKGFKRYDLNTYNNLAEGVFDKRGESIVNPITSYSTPEVGDEFDDSYYSNIINYRKANFISHSIDDEPQIEFNGQTSRVVVGHNEKFNFNPGDDFTINFKMLAIHPNDDCYLISKSTTKTVVPSPNQGAEIYTTNTTGALQPINVSAEPQYPFEIFYLNELLYFRRSDGDITTTISSSDVGRTTNHTVTCRVSSSQMEIFVDGLGSGISGSDNSIKQTQNNANIYIGNKGETNNVAEALHGRLSNIQIYNKALTDTQILNHYSSSNGSPYIGNIFYSSGIASITHPQYQTIASGPTGEGIIHELKFQGTHMIWENEYQCTVDEHEYNDTTNTSARKIRSNTSQDLADFATGSLFKPYVTTVGLYNEENELLVVGKLGQPIRCSDETDTTFVLRWDT